MWCHKLSVHSTITETISCLYTVLLLKPQAVYIQQNHNHIITFKRSLWCNMYANESVSILYHMYKYSDHTRIIIFLQSLQIHLIFNTWNNLYFVFKLMYCTYMYSQSVFNHLNTYFIKMKSLGRKYLHGRNVYIHLYTLIHFKVLST